MRIAIVAPYDWSVPGGVRSHVQGQADALRRLGDEVVVFAPSSRPAREIVSLGATLPMPANGSIARVSLDPRAVMRLRKGFEAGRFDVVHVHEPAVPLVSLAATLSSAVPVIGTFHASSDKALLYTVASPLLRRALARLSMRIAVSPAAERLATRHLGGEYEIVPNAVETSKWKASPDPPLERHRPYVLFVGRPEPRKGLDIAIAAMDKVRRGRTVNLVAVGPAQTDVPGWVISTGPLEQPQLAAAYAGAEAFIAPSLHGESFGIVLIEAMSAGTPVICSDIEGYVDAAGDAAVLSPVGDAGALADAIDRVVGDHRFADQLRAKGAERAKAFDWETVVHRVRACYERALS